MWGGEARKGKGKSGNGAIGESGLICPSNFHFFTLGPSRNGCAAVFLFLGFIFFFLFAFFSWIEQ